MKFICTLLFLFFTFSCGSQCLYSYTFQGSPGDVKLDSFEVIPNDFYRFDFSTLNVPDKLTVYTPTDSLEFTVGDQILITNFNLKLYRGYCEFEYDKVLMTKIIEGDTVPLDFSANNMAKDRRGTLRLYYRVNEAQCTLRFKISGNTKHQTVYDLCVVKLESGFIPVSDTIYTVYCGPKAQTYLDKDCKKYLIIYNDLSVKDNPIIKYNGCMDGEISVAFPNHPQYDTSGLKLGFNRITVSNGVCEKDFDFYFSPSTLCEYYVPNVISANGLNSVFKLYTKQDVQYDLKIFDRWGNMVWEGICISNVSGWAGVQFGSNVEVGLGVYTYVIKCLDQIIRGDVTVLK